MIERLKQVRDWGVTAELGNTDAKHVRTVNLTAMLASCAAVLWVGPTLAVGLPGVAWFNGVVALLLLLPVLLNRARRPTAATLFALLVGNVYIGVSTVLFGFASAAHLWFVLLMVAPFLMYPRATRGAVWVSAAIPFSGLALATWLRSELGVRVEVVDIDLQAAINAVFLSGVLVIVAAGFARSVRQTEDEINAQRARADGLLLNVLPPSIADRLKAAPDEPIADRFEDVTVLFADIVGFTPLSAILPAAEMVELLNELFSAFDATCDEHGAEKIKTIGDGYMAICGAPIPNPDHALVMARVAIAMQEVMRARPAEPRLELRVGLNTGTAVGAIVGRSRFHWDLWGDPVNIAARMESTGEAGRVQIAEATWERIRDTIPCTSRGTIEVKGRGAMETWFIDA